MRFVFLVVFSLTSSLEMSSRGRGTCPQCKHEYFNRSKPPNCENCGFSLGGSFISKKRVKQNNPLVVEICNGVYSCRTSARDDRCFVTSDGGNCWMCTWEQCKVLRSVHVNSGLTEQFQCAHVKQVQDSSNADPLATFNANLPSYPCSDIVRNQLLEIIASLPSNAPPVVQVSGSGAG